MGTNRLLDWLPVAKGWDGAFTHMPDRKTARRSISGEERFAVNFSQALSAWCAEDSARTERLFADLIGMDQRNLARWKTKGLQPFKPDDGSPLFLASGYLGVHPDSWWTEPETVPRRPLPSGYDIQITETLIRHVHRHALSEPTFRRALQDLIEKTQG